MVTMLTHLSILRQFFPVDFSERGGKPGFQADWKKSTDRPIATSFPPSAESHPSLLTYLAFFPCQTRKADLTVRRDVRRHGAGEGG
jgi:hypothetical protein